MNLDSKQVRQSHNQKTDSLASRNSGNSSSELNYLFLSPKSYDLQKFNSYCQLNLLKIYTQTGNFMNSWQLVNLINLTQSSPSSLPFTSVINSPAFIKSKVNSICFSATAGKPYHLLGVATETGAKLYKIGLETNNFSLESVKLDFPGNPKFAAHKIAFSKTGSALVVSYEFGKQVIFKNNFLKNCWAPV